jgi:GNAT superfamily N-acetyltransferase
MSAEAIVLPGQETLLVSWDALARLSPGAKLIRARRTVAAVFPSWAPLNNAILLRGGVDGAVTSDLRQVYADAGVDGWALWLPSLSTDLDAPDVSSGLPGLERDTTTLVMRTTLLRDRFGAHDAAVRTSISTATRATEEAVPATELEAPDGVPGLDGWVMVHDDLAVSGAWSMLHGSDCGIYAVGTIALWRRRGLATALMEHVLTDAWRRGARTASLQSTRMGRGLYASLGFEPVGRYEEWIPK